MYPRLFEIPEIFGIGPLTIYTYGVMLAAAYLAGLQLAIVRGRKAGLDAGRLLDLGVYIVIAALIGAKLLLLFVNFSYFRNNPRRDSRARPVGRRVLRRPHHRHARRVLVYPAPQAAVLDDVRHVRAGHRARPCHRTTRLPHGGMLLRPPGQRAVGDHLHRSVCRGQRRHAAERAAASDAGVRGRRGADHSDFSARHRAQGAALPRTHVLGLHAALRGLALHHRVLPRRRARIRDGPLDVAVHLGHARAVQPVHAVLPAPPAARPEPAKAARRAA